METLASWLLRKWDDVAAAGVMRTSVGDIRRRKVEGRLGTMVQFHPQHAQLKRPVAADLLRVQAAASTPDPAESAFNFIRVKECERLGTLRFALDAVTIQEETDASDQEQDVVLVNVSPLMRGHFLCILDIARIHPQALQRQFLTKAVTIATAMQRPDFALGFNSAGAWASVNHFHLQGFFLNEIHAADTESAEMEVFPILKQSRELLFSDTREGTTIHVQYLPGWPVRSFAIELAEFTTAGSRQEQHQRLVSVTWPLIEVLQDMKIPHNFLVVWSAGSLVSFVFPRQPQREYRLPKGSAAPFRFAIAELCGLIVASDEEGFDAFSEDAYEHFMQTEISLSQDELKDITSAWKIKMEVVDDGIL